MTYMTQTTSESLRERIIRVLNGFQIGSDELRRRKSFMYGENGRTEAYEYGGTRMPAGMHKDGVDGTLKLRLHLYLESLIRNGDYESAENIERELHLPRTFLNLTITEVLSVEQIKEIKNHFSYRGFS